MRTVRCALACALASTWSPAADAALQDPMLPHTLAQGAATFDAEAKPELEVQRAKTGHLLVRPWLNGREAGWFIFDTGAGICVISTPLAGDFELRDAGPLAASGVGGTSAAQALRAKELALGPVVLGDVPLMKTDLSFLAEHLGLEIAGVIGYGVLSQCVVEIDLVAPRIALHDPGTFTLASGAWSPLELDHLIPTVSARVEGLEGRFHLDIGSNSGLTLEEPAVRRWNLLEGRALTDAKIGGVGGMVAVKKGRVAWLELAGVRLEDVEATFALERSGVAGDGHDGSLGTRALESFALTLDYAGKRISFRPRGG